jgi:hypothetical protein
MAAHAAAFVVMRQHWHERHGRGRSLYHKRPVCCCRAGQLEAVKALLQHGASVEKQCEGSPPLHVAVCVAAHGACREFALAAASALLEAGADPYERCGRGIAGVAGRRTVRYCRFVLGKVAGLRRGKLVLLWTAVARLGLFMFAQASIHKGTRRAPHLGPPCAVLCLRLRERRPAVADRRLWPPHASRCARLANMPHCLVVNLP